MKILHVVWGVCNGGIETMLLNIVDEQKLRGQQPAIMIINDLYDQVLLDKFRCPIFRIGRKPGSINPMFLLKILRHYISYKADIVHFHKAALSKFFIIKRRHDKWIATCHAPLHGADSSYNKRIDTYTAISKCVLSDIRNNMPQANGKLCYNGLDISKLAVKKKYQIKQIKLICVGRMEFHIKGQDIIIRALKRLVSEGKDNIRIDFFGTGSDIENIKQYIAENNLSQYANVCGNIEHENVLKHLADYDLFIQASRYEGFGLTAVEAIGSGVPAILSNIDGHIEISENGKYATLFDSESVDDLAEKIKYCIEHYTEISDEMPNAVAYIERNFSITKMIDEFTEIYKIP